MKAFNAILIGLMLILSVFAGSAAQAIDTYQIPVSVFDTDNAKLTADTLTIANAADSWTVKNVQEYTFVLTKGEYTITAVKEGYKSADAVVKVEDLSPSRLPVTALKLEKIAVDDEDNGDTGDNGGVTEPNMKIDLKIKPDDEVKPGDEVTFEVEVDNKLGYDVEEVNVELTVKDIDDGDDFEDEAEVGDLDYKDDDKATFTYTVPYDADEDKYTVDIKVTWEDADGKEGKNTLTETLEVEKDKHDIAILNTYLGSTNVAPGKSAELSVELANIGKNDENVRIKVESQDLGIESWTAQFELKDGDTATQYIPFAVPKDAEAGKYFVYVTAYYNSGASSEMDFVTLTVGGETSAATGAVSLTPVITTVAGGDAGETGFTDDTYVVGGVIIGILVLLAVIAFVAKDILPKRTATIIESTTRKRR